MGALSILSAILSGLGTACKAAVSWFFARVPVKVWLPCVAIIAVFIFGYYKGHEAIGGSGMGCSCREFMCGPSWTERWAQRREEKTHPESGTVVSVESPNRFTIQQSHGRRKINREVTIRYIVDTQSHNGSDHVNSLLPVGSHVNIDAMGGRFGDAPEAQSSLPQQDDAGGESAKTTEETMGGMSSNQPMKGWTESVCDECGGKGTVTYEDGGVSLMAQAAFCFWMDVHIPKCARCKAAIKANNEDYCDDAREKWAAISAKAEGEKREPVTSECPMCQGTGKVWIDPAAMEARGPIVGVVTGATGENVGLSLVRFGCCKAASDAPKEYRDAEKEARKQQGGHWNPFYKFDQPGVLHEPAKEEKPLWEDE